jgi:hypothetical protein
LLTESSEVSEYSTLLRLIVPDTLYFAYACKQELIDKIATFHKINCLTILDTFENKSICKMIVKYKSTYTDEGQKFTDYEILKILNTNDFENPFKIGEIIIFELSDDVHQTMHRITNGAIGISEFCHVYYNCTSLKLTDLI